MSDHSDLLERLRFVASKEGYGSDVSLLLFEAYQVIKRLSEKADEAQS